MNAAIQLKIFPFALSLSKGEWKNSSQDVKPFMLRQAQHERLNVISRSQALAWECLPSSSAWRSGHINVKINLFCSPSHQAELGNRHSQTGVWERDKQNTLVPTRCVGTR